MPRGGVSIAWSAACGLALLATLVTAGPIVCSAGARHPGLRRGAPAARACGVCASDTRRQHGAKGCLCLRGGYEEVPQVIVLDVDGTLYGSASGIEQQIVANIHRFALSCKQLTPDDADALHSKYGSTIAGLKTEHALSRDDEERFYREVYSAIDYSGLLDSDGAEGDSSGYKHSASVRAILQRCDARLALASNSPSWHVQRVLTLMGLADLDWCLQLTPDVREGLTKSDPLFWSPLVEQYQPLREGSGWGGVWAQGGYYHVDLLDDSQKNLAVAELLGMRGTLVRPDEGFPVQQALLQALGILSPRDQWTFDTVKYLRAKNEIDKEALAGQVRTRLASELATMDTASGPLRIVDLGAGLLPMLPLLLDVLGHSAKQVAEGEGAGGGARGLCKGGVDYVALETEESLFRINCDSLVQAGYVQLEAEGEGMATFIREESGASETQVRVTLLTKAFQGLAPRTLGPIHLFVAACFADLMEPGAFVRALLRLAGGMCPATLVW